MSVTEKLMASGTFTLQLNKSNTPNTIINKIDAWGHIIIVPGDLNVNEFNDSTLLDASKYTGIVQSLELGDEELVTINGQGLIAYLGTGDTTGMGWKWFASLELEPHNDPNLHFVIDFEYDLTAQNFKEEAHSYLPIPLTEVQSNPSID